MMTKKGELVEDQESKKKKMRAEERFMFVG